MSKHDDDTCPHLVRASLLEAENARLKAEVERLRKAGDAMHDGYIRIYGGHVGNLAEEYIEAWRAAKEGKPSV